MTNLISVLIDLFRRVFKLSPPSVSPIPTSLQAAIATTSTTLVGGVSSGISPPTPQGTIAEPAWIGIARKEIGVHETPGPDATQRIIEYASATSLKATSDEVPWCSSFANWVMREAGVKGTNSAAASSWLTWGAPLQAPKYGCIVVFQRIGGHHVAFWLGQSATQCQILGGNQNNSVCIENRATALVLAYRWPENV